MRADNLAGGRERGEFIAVMHVTVLDFMVPRLREGWERGGRLSRTAVGTAERYKSMPKAACVKANYFGCIRGMPCQTALSRPRASQPVR